MTKCCRMLLTAFMMAMLVQFGKADLLVGKEFVFAFPCFTADYTPVLVVINSNTNQTSVSVDSSILGFTSMQYTVAGNSSIQINFTDAHVLLGMPVCDTDFVNQQGFRVRTSLPVTLYACLYQPNSYYQYQFTILPVNFLSSQYPYGNISSMNKIIVGSQDGTILTIGNTQVTLNNLDVYYDTSNAISAANAPFAFLTVPGNMPIATMALPNNYGSTTTYYVPPRYGNYDYQIWAVQNNTQVSINGGSNTTVNVGSPYVSSDLNNGGSVVTSSPVQIALSGYYEAGYFYGPENFWSSSAQFYSIFVPNNNHVLRIVAPLFSTGNIMVDGQVIQALQYKRVPYSHYYYCDVSISADGMLHTVTTRAPNSPYFAQLFLYNGYSAFTVAANITVTSSG